MDSLEGDIGIPSFIDARPRSPPRRSTTLPSSESTATPHIQHARALSSQANTASKDLTRRLSFPDARLQDETLASLRRWIIGFVLVDFDVDTGPNVDNNYPHFNLPTSIRNQLAFSSLPEGDLPPSLTDQGYLYNWRIPYPPEAELEKSEQDQRQPILRLPKPSSDEAAETDGALYGYVWFSQEQNSSLRRNYSQRSLVLLTHHPHLPGLFSSVLSILGPLHFLHAKQPGAKGGMVESACLNIASWPAYQEGTALELPLLGSVLNVEIPLPFQAQYPRLAPSIAAPALSDSSRKMSASIPSILTSTTLAPPVVPATHPLTPLSLLLFSSPTISSASSKVTATHDSNPDSSSRGEPGLGFTKLLLIWELLVLEEPLLIYVNDPRTGSELLCHLRNLMRPLPFKGDFKPYFHIHDPAFPILCGRPGSKPRPGLLLSSTNPLVLKNCQKSWPHILRLDRPTTTATNPIRSNSLPNPTPAGANTLSPISATTSPAISPLIGRRKEVFGDSHSSRAPSRSSSVASTNRLRPSGNDQADTWSGASSTRSSSPISFMSSSTSTGSPRPPPPSFVGTTPSKKTALASANGSESWWGLKSERKRHLKKDDAVFKLIEKRFREGDYVGCDEVIYKHFASLTEKLLAPMSRYLLTTHTSASPSSVDFLTSLKAHGTPLVLKSANAFSISFAQPGTSSTERFYSKVWETSTCRAWREGRERERRKVVTAAGYASPHAK